MENDAQKPAGPPPPPDLPKPSFMPPPPTPPAPPMGPPPTKFNPPGHSPIQVDRAPAKKIEAASADFEEAEVGSEAGFQPRLFGALIDLGVILGLSITVKILLPASINSYVSYIVMAAYALLRDALPFLGGRSIGKVAMKLQAVTLDDKSLSGNWKASVIRNIMALIPPIGPVIEAFILNSRQGGETLRRLGDDFAKTKVLYVGLEPITAEGKPSLAPSSSDEEVSSDDKSESTAGEDEILDAKSRKI